MKLKQFFSGLGKRFKMPNIYLKFGTIMLFLTALEVWTFPVWGRFLLKNDYDRIDNLFASINIILLLIIGASIIIGIRKSIT